MAYELVIADRMYSSWSLRGWLMFEKFGLDVSVRHARMATPEFADTLSEFGSARLVPAMRAGDVVVWESLAMAETLAERHPDRGFWPADPVARGLARSIVAEMHSGFTALRGACAMNLWHAYQDFRPTPEVTADVDRIVHLFGQSRTHACDGPWLFGAYSLADVFYAPVAARIAGHGIAVPAFVQDYVEVTLADPSFRRWRAMGLAENRVMDRYALPNKTMPWPGPPPLPAAVSEGPAINSACPYSGKPVAADSIAEIAGHKIGFCNQFCRDKTVADPAAWPAAMSLLPASSVP